MIYFTSDQHFDHINVIKYCDRPFKDIKTMNNTIIKNYNNIISNEDIVYMLGDFSLYGPTHKLAVEVFVQKLRGQKHLILGNHDRLSPSQYLEIGFLSVHTTLILDDFILVHDPALSILDKSKICLCGHIHNLFKRINNVINVGVDVWDFNPVSIEEINDLL
jgi:calcineurin-like phosphoesterase family protein